MVLNNNIYFNAAFRGAFAGFLKAVSTSGIGASTTATDYNPLVVAATALATQVDSKIAFDALVSTGASNTQLAITTNTIAANEQARAQLLEAICCSVTSGEAPVNSLNPNSGTAASWDQAAKVIFAMWTQALTALVTP